MTRRANYLEEGGARERARVVMGTGDAAHHPGTPCAHCGNTYTKPGGAHWQGGGGCRDQQRLSTKDSRKHKGASATGTGAARCT